MGFEYLKLEMLKKNVWNGYFCLLRISIAYLTAYIYIGCVIIITVWSSCKWHKTQRMTTRPLLKAGAPQLALVGAIWTPGYNPYPILIKTLFSQITLFNSTILVYLKHYTMVRDWSVESCVRFSRISYVGHVTYETFKRCDRIIVSILK